MRRAKEIHQKWTINELKNIVKKYNGTLTFKNDKPEDFKVSKKFRMDAQCINGHSWNTNVDSFIRGAWCKECLKHSELAPFQHVQSIIEFRGGQCLSIEDEFKNSNSEIKVQCSLGHTFDTKLSRLKSGSWCKKCMNPDSSIEQAYDIAYKNNGKCLTEKENFIDGNQKLKWLCNCGYSWDKPLAAMKTADCWCPKCANKVPFTIDDVKLEINLRGWTLLNEEYTHNKKLKIKCRNNHIFNKLFGDIKYGGGGCTYCNTRKTSEYICKVYMQTIFNKDFTTVRPKYMEGLELDGYCAELGIAFEHNGAQHYDIKSCNFISKSKDVKIFTDLQQRDVKKIELCKTFGIKLVIIPALFKMTKLDNLLSLIKVECYKLSINLPGNINELEFKIDDIYNRSKKSIKKCEVIFK